MKNLKLVISCLLVATFFGCSNSDSYETPDLSAQCSDLTTTISTQTVLGMINNSLQQYPIPADPADEGDIIEAYVTSSDEGGNFFKLLTLVTTDGTQGFSVPIDNYNLYNEFEPGRKVFIKLKGLYYQTNANTFSKEIGGRYDNNTPTNLVDDEVGRISGVEYNDVIIRGCSKVNEQTLVNNITIAQAKNNSYLNKLIELDNVQFTDASMGKNYYEPTSDLGGATNHEIVDANGAKLIVRVSKYSNFAGLPVSSLRGKIRGVMTKYNSDFQFMVRTINDIKLTEPRTVPYFSEDFTTNFPNWVKFSVVGPQNWLLNATNGNPGKCADMNGFSSGAVQNDDWLISPAINLASAPTAFLSFQTSRPFSGNNLEVYASINYSGSGAPSTATWTLLGGQLATSGTWINSGNVSLAAYLGNPNVRIAFRYTSTSSSAPQWRVDNVKVQAF